MANRDNYRQWPFLSQEEFELACAFFDQRYIQAKLGPVRNIFKLRSCRALTTGETYIEIIRLLILPEDVDGLSNAFQNMSTGMLYTADQDFEIEREDEDGDPEALHCTKFQAHTISMNADAPPGYSLYSHQSYVVYEIHLHPTYRVPTLWFSLHDLPAGEPAFDIESVYRYLVPNSFKTQLRSIGVLGGISAALHPITGIPTFFIHPCQTSEAMEAFDCSLNNYLTTWLGLVGGCVDLWIPPELVMNVNGG